MREQQDTKNLAKSLISADPSITEDRIQSLNAAVTLYAQFRAAHPDEPNPTFPPPPYVPRRQPQLQRAINFFAI